MHRGEPVFVCILLLTAVMVGCTNSVDVTKAVDNPSSSDSTEKPAATSPQPNTQWPPPAAQETVSQPPAPNLPSRILTKDPEYRALIKPPTGDGFLKTYSTEYNARLVEVEASVANINDKTLREKARTDKWKNVDKSDFERQAIEAHTTKLREYMSQHRDGWIEVGHCEYDPSTQVLRVYSIPASPFQAPNKFEIRMDIATIDAIYNKFRSLAEPRISARIDRDVWEYFAQEDSPTYSREQVTQFLRAQRYKTYESSIRLEQMVVIGQGDLSARNIERLSIVDYPTETVLLELDPKIFTASNPSWLY